MMRIRTVDIFAPIVQFRHALKGTEKYDTVG